MFSDSAAKTVYVSLALNRYPEVFSKLCDCLLQHDISLEFVYYTTNIWCRDYMPVQIDRDRFVKFNYKKSKKYPQLKVPPRSWNHIPNVKKTNIVLDGGNCVRRKNKAIITDMVFKHNPQYNRQTLEKKLEKLLEAEIVIIPCEPNDDLGHADGAVKFIDDSTAYVNNYRSMNKPIYDRFMDQEIKVLNAHGISCVPFPYAYHKRPRMTEKQFRKLYPDSDAWNSGWGYFVNMLIVKGLVVLPVFGIEEDAQTVNLIKRDFPDSDYATIDCSRLSLAGGLINCVTMNYV